MKKIFPILSVLSILISLGTVGFVATSSSELEAVPCDEVISSTPAESSEVEVEQIPGPQGPAGECGPPGEQGEAGEQGETGAGGEAGEQGVTGAGGETGEQGEKGDTGYTVPLTGVNTDIIPTEDNAFTLGSAELRFADLYLGPNSIKMTDVSTLKEVEIVVDGGTMLLDGVESFALGNMQLNGNGIYSILSGQDVQIGLPGDTGFLAPSNGLKFPDGTVQTTAVVAGPRGVTGPQGPTGPTGPRGPIGPSGGEQGPAGPQGETGPTGPTGAAALIPGKVSYQPTFGVVAGSGDAPTWTSEPATGSFVKLGNLVFFDIEVSLATISDFGSGKYTLTLPFASDSNFTVRSGGIHSGGSKDNHFNLAGEMTAGSSVMELRYASGTQDEPFDHKSPYSLSTAGEFHISGVYTTG